MGSFNDTTEVTLLNALFGNATFATQSMWVALFTAAPSDASGGTEVTGGNYGRVKCGTWTSAAAGAVANATTVTFPTTTLSWGTVTHFAVFDGSTTAAGNMIGWATLTAAKAVGTNDVAQFGTGSLSISLD